MRRGLNVATGLALVAALLSGCLGKKQDTDAGHNSDVTEFTLTIAGNAISGGKNAQTADWVEKWVIPQFVEAQKAKGRKATVKFQASGAGDEDYKSKIALDLKTGGGADVLAIDGIWTGKFAEAGYLRPLDDLVGVDKVNGWEGWAQIPPMVQGIVSYNGKRYGVPSGTDGRVIYFNRKIFAQAGLPADWQPRSWDDILRAGQAVKAKLPDVTPIQLNAGKAMGEATTMQGILPLLVGTGKQLYADGKWLGDGKSVEGVLDFYSKVYNGGLGDKVIQQDAKGRDKSFASFAAGKTAILLEGDYFWRGVVEPTKGVAKMADRDATVGYALIPAMAPGGGVRGQDYVSMSGGSGNVVNPATKFPQQAWELLQFMNSAEATRAQLGTSVRITQRSPVDRQVLARGQMLKFVAAKVLPVTNTRPPLAVYPRVSLALQEATGAIVEGRSVADAAAAYQRALQEIVGADKISSG